MEDGGIKLNRLGELRNLTCSDPLLLVLSVLAFVASCVTSYRLVASAGGCFSVLCESTLRVDATAAGSEMVSDGILNISSISFCKSSGWLPPTVTVLDWWKRRLSEQPAYYSDWCFCSANGSITENCQIRIIQWMEKCMWHDSPTSVACRCGGARTEPVSCWETSANQWW